MKSLSLAPPATSFNLSSLSLACDTPPCNVTMYGQSVAMHTQGGSAAGTLLTNLISVEAAMNGAEDYTRVEGLEERGWVQLAKVSFVVRDGGGGLGLDNVVYRVAGGGCG